MAEILIGAQVLVLAFVALLVVGLLRSHSEILLRLSAVETGTVTSSADLVERGNDSSEAFDIAGRTLEGESLKLALQTGGRKTLLAFLSSGCSACLAFWSALQPEHRGLLPLDVRLAIVTKDSSHESPSKLRSLAPSDVQLVMSSQAWEAYEVSSAPYFIFVDGSSGKISGEGMAQSWDQVMSLLADGLEDLRLIGESGKHRLNDIDWDNEQLARSGIQPGNSSLWDKTSPQAEEESRK